MTHRQQSSYLGRRQSGQGIDMKGATNNDGNNNSKTRRPTKIVSFSINIIIGHRYFIELTIEMMKLIKNLLKLKQQEATRATAAIAKPTPNILNFVSFLSTIDSAILSNLQL